MGFISGLCLCKLKECLEKLKLVDFWMYMYVLFKISNVGIEFVRLDENSFCVSGFVCLVMMFLWEICLKFKLCGIKLFIRECLVEEMVLCIYKNNKIYILKVVLFIWRLYIYIVYRGDY